MADQPGRAGSAMGATNGQRRACNRTVDQQHLLIAARL
jgi:hypothetical protein